MRIFFIVPVLRLENVLLNQGLEASSLFESVPGSLNQNGIGRHVMNAFFKCLYSDDIRCSKLSKRERNEVSKLVNAVCFLFL